MTKWLFNVWKLSYSLSVYSFSEEKLIFKTNLNLKRSCHDFSEVRDYIFCYSVWLIHGVKSLNFNKWIKSFRSFFFMSDDLNMITILSSFYSPSAATNIFFIILKWSKSRNFQPRSLVAILHIFYLCICYSPNKTKWLFLSSRYTLRMYSLI